MGRHFISHTHTFRNVGTTQAVKDYRKDLSTDWLATGAPIAKLAVKRLVSNSIIEYVLTQKCFVCTLEPGSYRLASMDYRLTQKCLFAS